MQLKENAPRIPMLLELQGWGKSKFLEHILFQDVINGRGCGVLDPHSDLVDDLFRYLHSNPQESTNHWERIIYFGPLKR